MCFSLRADAASLRERTPISKSSGLLPYLSGISLFEGIQEWKPGFPFWVTQFGTVYTSAQSDAGGLAQVTPEGRDPAQDFIGRILPVARAGCDSSVPGLDFNRLI
jgi:hypothetical protein